MRLYTAHTPHSVVCLQKMRAHSSLFHFDFAHGFCSLLVRSLSLFSLRVDFLYSVVRVIELWQVFCARVLYCWCILTLAASAGSISIAACFSDVDSEFISLCVCAPLCLFVTFNIKLLKACENSTQSTVNTSSKNISAISTLDSTQSSTTTKEILQIYVHCCCLQILAFFSLSIFFARSKQNILGKIFFFYFEIETAFNSSVDQCVRVFGTFAIKIET